MGGIKNRDAKRTKAKVFASGGGGGTKGPSVVDKRLQDLPCPYCSKVYKQSERLRGHIKRLHPEAPENGGGVAGGGKSAVPKAETVASPMMDVASAGGYYAHKSPKLLLHEWCLSKKLPRPRYKTIGAPAGKPPLPPSSAPAPSGPGGGYRCKVVLPHPTNSDRDAVTFLDADLAAPDSDEAAQRGALAALQSVAGDRALERVLPPQYLELWATLGARARERRERDAARKAREERHAEAQARQAKREAAERRNTAQLVMTDEHRRALEGIVALGLGTSAGGAGTLGGRGAGSSGSLTGAHAGSSAGRALSRSSGAFSSAGTLSAGRGGGGGSSGIEDEGEPAAGDGMSDVSSTYDPEDDHSAELAELAREGEAGRAFFESGGGGGGGAAAVPEDGGYGSGYRAPAARGASAAPELGSTFEADPHATLDDRVGELSALGFTEKHALAALRRRGAAAPISELLDWLVLNVPESELPKGLAPGAAGKPIAVVHVSAKDGGGGGSGVGRAGGGGKLLRGSTGGPRAPSPEADELVALGWPREAVEAALAAAGGRPLAALAALLPALLEVTGAWGSAGGAGSEAGSQSPLAALEAELAEAERADRDSAAARVAWADEPAHGKRAPAMAPSEAAALREEELASLEAIYEDSVQVVSPSWVRVRIPRSADGDAERVALDIRLPSGYPARAARVSVADPELPPPFALAATREAAAASLAAALSQRPSIFDAVEAVRESLDRAASGAKVARATTGGGKGAGGGKGGLPAKGPGASARGAGAGRAAAAAAAEATGPAPAATTVEYFDSPGCLVLSDAQRRTLEARASGVSRLDEAKEAVAKARARLPRGAAGGDGAATASAAATAGAGGQGRPPRGPRAQGQARQLGREAVARESERLTAQAREWASSAKGKQMRAARAKLPAGKARAEVLAAVAARPVLVIGGATGCGKSTQVPQFVLEDAVERGLGGLANVIVSQPRRVAATSVATRVAAERGESPGETVGWSVRGDTVASERTRVLFCTTGVLLRRLLSDPDLTGTSHVVVDEVHERSVESDLILLLLRRTVLRAKLRRDAWEADAPRRAGGATLGGGGPEGARGARASRPPPPAPKILLMSATARSEEFASYYDAVLGEGRTATLEIPGFTYPVRERFLEDVLEETGFLVGKSSKWARPDAAKRIAKAEGGIARAGDDGDAASAKGAKGAKGPKGKDGALKEGGGKEGGAKGKEGGGKGKEGGAKGKEGGAKGKGGGGRSKDGGTKDGGAKDGGAKEGGAPKEGARGPAGKGKDGKGADASADQPAARDPSAGSAPRQYGERTMTSLECIDESMFNHELVTELVCKLVAKMGEKASPLNDGGSILVFASGVQEIDAALQALRSCRVSGRLRAVPLHGQLPPAAQRAAFERPPPGVIKVVVSTNVAETSVTIDDVTVVVDPGRARQTGFDAARGLAKLEDAWISRAAAAQRAGRAGRVRPGECWRLFSRRTREASMPPHTAPEALRAPLSRALLTLAATLPQDDAAELARELPTRPNEQSIAQGVEALRELGALNADRRGLTPLGETLARLPVDAPLAKMLVTACVLRCVAPALTIAAAAGGGGKPVLLAPREARDEARAAHARLAAPVARSKSDHLVLVAAYEAWASVRAERGRKGARDFAFANFLHAEGMETIREARGRLAQELEAAGLLPHGYAAREGRIGTAGSTSGSWREVDAADDATTGATSSDPDAASRSARIVKAAIAAGLYPSVLRVKAAAPKYTKTIAGTVETAGDVEELRFFDRRDARVLLHPASALSRESTFESGWIAYGERLVTTRDYARDCTAVPAYALTLLCGADLEVDHGRGTLTLDGWASFRAPARIAVLVRELRAGVGALLRDKLRDPSVDVTASPVARALHVLLHSDGFAT